MNKFQQDKQAQLTTLVRGLQFDSFDLLVLKCTACLLPWWQPCAMLDLSPGEIPSIHIVSFQNSTIIGNEYKLNSCNLRSPIHFYQ